MDRTVKDDIDEGPTAPMGASPLTQRLRNRCRVGDQGCVGNLICCLLDVVAGGPAAEREPQRGQCPARVVSHGQQYRRRLRDPGVTGCTGGRSDAWSGGQQVISAYGARSGRYLSYAWAPLDRYHEQNSAKQRVATPASDRCGLLPDAPPRSTTHEIKIGDPAKIALDLALLSDDEDCAVYGHKIT
jgi:hypothetical protein